MGKFGDDFYERTLDADEEAVVAVNRALDDADRPAQSSDDRDASLEAARAELAAALAERGLPADWTGEEAALAA